jgi:hypothetical protein
MSTAANAAPILEYLLIALSFADRAKEYFVYDYLSEVVVLDGRKVNGAGRRVRATPGRP